MTLSPVPEVGSESLGLSDFAERRRLPRLSISGEQFRHSLGKVFAVTDLSTDGMRLRILDPADLAHFTVAAEFEGTINLKGEKHLIRAKVRNIAPGSVGCEFLASSARVCAALAEFLNPAALGRELRPIPTSADGGGTHVWYHGPSGADLILRRSPTKTDGSFRRVTLYVLGGYIQWDEKEGLTTGRAEKSESPDETRGLLVFETWILHEDEQVSVEQLKVAKTLILSSNLPEELKSWCQQKLSAATFKGK